LTIKLWNSKIHKDESPARLSSSLQRRAGTPVFHYLKRVTAACNPLS
jgi:hypothetical protein